MLDYLLEVVKVVIACSIPLSFTSLLVSFSFWGIPVRPLLPRILVLVTIHSVIVDLLFFIVPNYMRLIDFMGLYFIFTLLIFRSLSIKMRCTITLSAIIFGFLAETIVATFQNHFYPNDVIINNFSIMIWGYWPMAGILYLIHYLLETFNISPGKSILSFIRRKRDRKIPALMLFFAGQSIFIAWSLGFRLISDYEIWLANTLLMIAVACTMFSLILVLKVVTESRNEAVKMTQEYYIDDINRMFTTIRGQRHDFMNHVQVISSFIKMGKMDDLERYTQELVGETTEINDIMSIGNPALAALVQAKSTVALAHKIHFMYDCSGMESPSLGVKSIDLIKVLGNLLDNAFDEAKLLPPNKRVVELECKTVQNCLSMSVRNRGTYIPDDARKKLFQPGFSTKTGEHQGIGLAIVKERLDFYQGTIEVHSSPADGTAFHIRIPQKKVSALR